MPLVPHVPILTASANAVPSPTRRIAASVSDLLLRNRRAGNCKLSNGFTLKLTRALQTRQFCTRRSSCSPPACLGPGSPIPISYATEQISFAPSLHDMPPFCCSLVHPYGYTQSIRDCHCPLSQVLLAYHSSYQDTTSQTTIKACHPLK